MKSHERELNRCPFQRAVSCLRQLTIRFDGLRPEINNRQSGQGIAYFPARLRECLPAHLALHRSFNECGRSLLASARRTLDGALSSRASHYLGRDAFRFLCDRCGRGLLGIFFTLAF